MSLCESCKIGTSAASRQKASGRKRRESRPHFEDLCRGLSHDLQGFSGSHTDSKETNNYKGNDIDDAEGSRLG